MASPLRFQCSLVARKTMLKATTSSQLHGKRQMQPRTGILFQVSFFNFIVFTFPFQDQADGAVTHPHRDRLEYIFHFQFSFSCFQFQCCHAVWLQDTHTHQKHYSKSSQESKANLSIDLSISFGSFWLDFRSKLNLVFPFPSLRRKRSKKKGKRTERTTSSLLSFLETPACFNFYSLCTFVKRFYHSSFILNHVHFWFKQDWLCGTGFGRCSCAIDGGSNGIADMRPNNREQADACPRLVDSANLLSKEWVGQF